MNHSMKKIVPILALIICMFSFSSCTAETKSFEMSPQDIASGFVEAWRTDYQKIQESSAMMLSEGKAFLTDLTGDGLPELFFLYDDYKNSGVAVYDISGSKIQSLGRFTASSFYNHENLIFELYGSSQGNIIYTKSVQYGGVMENRNFVTEVFAGLSDGMIHIDTLSSVVYTDGTGAEYWNSAEDGTLITEEEYNKRRNNILGDSVLLDTVVLSADSAVCEFTKDETLQEYILELLNAYSETETAA